MVVLYILGALLLLIFCVLMIRVGVLISFGQELCVKIKIGPLTKQILPKSDKPKKPKKPKKPRKPKKPKDGESKPESSQKEKKKRKLSFEEICSVVPALFESLKKGLRKIRRRLKIHPMTMSVTFGHDDPAKVAEMFGWASSAMWTAMPQLERLTRMTDPRIHLDVDYNARQTKAEGEIGLSLLILDGLAIALSFGTPLLKWYLSLRNNRTAQEKADNDNKNNSNEDKGES